MDVGNIAQCNSVHNIVLVNFALDTAPQGCLGDRYHLCGCVFPFLYRSQWSPFIQISKRVWFGEGSGRNMLTGIDPATYGAKRTRDLKPS